MPSGSTTSTPVGIGGSCADAAIDAALGVASVVAVGDNGPAGVATEMPDGGLELWLLAESPEASGSDMRISLAVAAVLPPRDVVLGGGFFARGVTLLALGPPRMEPEPAGPPVAGQGAKGFEFNHGISGESF